MKEEEIEVLLVEDDPEEAELALRALKRGQLVKNVVHARDGEEALQLIFGPPPPGRTTITPRLVLLDLKLPKVDGFEVLEKLKADERTRSIPVVVLTSSKLDKDVARCYQLGGNSYIVKPVDFEKFAEIVAQLGLYWLLFNRQNR